MRILPLAEAEMLPQSREGQPDEERALLRAEGRRGRDQEERCRRDSIGGRHGRSLTQNSLSGNRRGPQAAGILSGPDQRALKKEALPAKRATISEPGGSTTTSWPALRLSPRCERGRGPADVPSLHDQI